MSFLKSNMKYIKGVIKEAGYPHIKKGDIQEFIQQKNDELVLLWEKYQNDEEVVNRIEEPQEEQNTVTSVDNKEKSEKKEEVVEECRTIKNGIIGEQYKTELKLPDDCINNIEIKAEDKIGELNYNEETLELSALPLEKGDTEIVIEYAVKKRINLKLYINDNPRNMWEDIPSAEVYKKDNESSFIENNDFSIIAASRRGRSHANKGTYRDDHTLTKFYNNWAIAIVSDGAGSAKLSSLGSKVVSETAMDCIIKNLDKEEEKLLQCILLEQGDAKSTAKMKRVLYEILVDSAHKAMKAMHQTAKEKGIAVKDLSTTLTIAIVKKFEFGKFVATFQVGDGAVVTYNAKNIDLLCKLDAGEYKGQTFFLNSKPIFASSEELLDRIFFKIYKNDTTILLMTDGVVDPFFDGDTNLLYNQNEWDKLWGIISESIKSTDAPEKSLLEWLNFYVKGEHDDRTIAIIIDK